MWHASSWQLFIHFQQEIVLHRLGHFLLWRAQTCGRLAREKLSSSLIFHLNKEFQLSQTKGDKLFHMASSISKAHRQDTEENSGKFWAKNDTRKTTHCTQSTKQYYNTMKTHPTWEGPPSYSYALLSSRSRSHCEQNAWTINATFDRLTIVFFKLIFILPLLKLLLSMICNRHG